jgi:uncharacterized protein
MLVRKCLVAALLFQACGVQALDEAELADLVQRPSIGLYKAYAEFKMADYASAGRIWQALAERGVAEAWFNLGILAEDGLGQPADPALALERYRRGAEAGSVKAQYRLGLLYLDGRLTEADPVQARRWLSEASAAGDEEAARMLKALDEVASPR